MNKRNRWALYVCGGIFMAGTSLMQVAAAAPPPSYPVMCTGGGNMYFQVSTMPGRNPTAHVTIWFVRGTSAASQQPPRKGECTWLDRGMRGDEPRTLITTVRGTSAVPVLHANGKLSRWEFAPSSGPATGELKRLLSFIQNGGSFQFEAHQARSAMGSYLQARPLGSRR